MSTSPLRKPPALRLKNRWFRDGASRSAAEQASAVAFIVWRVARNMLERMRGADFAIDAGRPYLDFMRETLVFLVAVADRIAHERLDADQRREFTVALVRRLAEVMEENRDMRVAELPAGESAAGFVDLSNPRGGDYAACGLDDAGPDFGFRRVFAAGMEAVLPQKDRLWAIDQIMEIEVPEAMKALRRTLDGLFAPDVSRTARTRGELAGE